jgi:hypothetical protein
MNTDSHLKDNAFPTADEAAAIRAEDCRWIHARLSQIAKQRAGLDAQEARALVLAEELEIWTVYGYTTMLAYLEGELGYAPHTAHERLRVANALRDLPLIAARLQAGALHHSAVRELTRVATSDTEAAWLDAAADKNLRQIERLVAGHGTGDLPDDEPDPDLELRKVTTEMSPATYALYRQALRHMDDLTGERLSQDVALAMIFSGALESAPYPSDKPPAQISYTVCRTCRRGTQDGAGIEVDVDAATIARALCDAEILGDVSATMPARTTTTVTPRTRKQVFARDHHRCAVAGCRNARYLQIHHIEFQSNGGGHEIANLISLCTAHHDLLHHGKLVIRGSAPELVFTRITDDGSALDLAHPLSVEERPTSSHVGERARVPLEDPSTATSTPRFALEDPSHVETRASLG